MSTQATGADKAALVQEHLHVAINEYDGMCAAAALLVLGRLFGVSIDSAVLASGTGIRFGGVQGAAQSAVAGASQFIAYAAHLQGLGQGETIRLCQAWQHRYEEHWGSQCYDAGPEETAAVAAILLAHSYIEENRQVLGFDRETEKPKQYYDSIYTDRESMFKHSPYALEEKLAKAVTKGEEATALAALREITAQGEKAVLAKDPLRSVKNSMIGSIAFLARAAIQAGVTANDAFALSDALTQKVEEMSSRSAVLAFEEKLLLQFIALVRQRLEASYTAPVIRVMHYLENHLDGKISLDDAAAYAGVHPAYLSARFKQEVGMNFTAYIALRKIQESSYFVRHTGYSVSQIASLYGFSSQSYYITTFKRVMGITPMEYRRRLLAE